MQVTGSERDQVLRFETNVHDFATAGAEHALRIDWTPATKPRPIFTFARALRRLSAARCFTTCGYGRDGRRPVRGVERKCFSRLRPPQMLRPGWRMMREHGLQSPHS